MKRFRLNERGKKVKKAAIFAFLGVAVLLIFILSFKLFINKTVVTAANGSGKDKKIEVKHEDKGNSSSPKQLEEDKIQNPKLPTNVDKDKTAYLTFDDGPNRKITPQILDVLKKYDVKATFFVIGKCVENNKDILLREKQEGHVIGNHTYSHDYKYLYSSTSSFLQDLDKNQGLISSVVGDYDTKLIRFPGGSFGKDKAAERQAATDAGYHYVDWNCLSGDAEALNVPVEKLVEKVKETSKGKKRIVILMHDAGGKETTVQALPDIINYLKSQGYDFKTLE